MDNRGNIAENENITLEIASLHYTLGKVKEIENNILQNQLGKKESRTPIEKEDLMKNIDQIREDQMKMMNKINTS